MYPRKSADFSLTKEKEKKIYQIIKLNTTENGISVTRQKWSVDKSNY